MTDEMARVMWRGIASVLALAGGVPALCAAADAAPRGDGLMPPVQLAQFELPTPAATGATRASPLAAPTRLRWQYSYGIEAPITWVRDRDLDTRLPDDFSAAKPKLKGQLTWRPMNWLSATLEMTLEHEFVLHEVDPTVRPSGEVVPAPQRNPTLVVDQALINVRGITAPFEFNVGRRNYEDERHFLYDTSIDVASVSLHHESVRAEAFIGRDVLWSLDLLQHAQHVPTEMLMLRGDYRGFDNHVLSAYAMRRHDRSGQEGAPVTIGLHASGRPTPQFSYWSEFALQRGHDENARALAGRALDVGATYRFANLPYDPNITLAYAFGSGDAGGERNTAFRQTGLHSNEAKYIGLAKFKTWGEMLDPELSNLRIATVGVGARATPGVSIDLVYHRYHLDQLASELRNGVLTALMNQPGTPSSKDVGQEVDLVIGFRGLFGLRRLGLDLRMGRFFPGKAFRTPVAGSPATLGRANNGAIVVAKFRW